MVKAGSGVDVWTYYLCGALQKRGVEIDLHEYPHHFQYYPHLLKLVDRKTDADIIHTNTWNGFAFKDSRPMVTTEHHVIHNKSFNATKNIFQKIYHRYFVFYYEKKTLFEADAAVSVSKYTKQQVKDVFNITTECISNGIDTEFFRPQTETVDLFEKNKGKTVIFYSGNMTKRKGVDLFPEIMRKLGNDFVLFCTTGLRSSRFDGCDNTIIVGYLTQNELVNFYSQCDLFIFPTRVEGFGLSVAEAMACGAPVVTTDCCSMPELIVDGQGGFLCKKDSVDSFVEKIKILAENKKLAKKMGSFNRKRIEEQFTLEKMAENYIRIYQELLR
jgi:glycosyltransferase involved in cell wall biosynthesis